MSYIDHTPSRLLAAIADHLDRTGKSARALAIEAGLGEKVVADIISGRVRLPERRTIEALALVLGMPTEEFLPAATLLDRHPTMQDVLDAVTTATDLPQSTRDRMRRDILSYCWERRLQPPSDIPATRGAMKTYFADKKPAVLGFPTQDRLRQYCRSLEQGIDLVARMSYSRRAQFLPDEWRYLLDLFPTGQHRRHLFSAFFRWASGAGLMPADINDSSISDYRAWAIQEGKISQSDAALDRKLKELMNLWNKACDTFLTWPKTKLTLPPDLRYRYLLGEDALSPLISDWDRYASWASGQTDREGRNRQESDPGDNFSFEQPGFRKPPLMPNTIVKQRGSLLLAARTLVALGVAPEDITSIAAVVEPDRVQMVLRDVAHRHQNEPRKVPHCDSTYSLTLAKHLHSLAMDWGSPTERDNNKLQQLVAAAGKPITGTDDRGRKTQLRGMSPTRRRAVRSLIASNQAMAILTYPFDLADELDCTRKKNGGAVTLAMARNMRLCAALVILRVSPIRLADLDGLRLDSNIFPPLAATKAHLQLVTAKSNVEIRREINDERWSVLETYIKHYRPLLTVRANPYLFPAETSSDRPIHRNCLSNQISGRMETVSGHRLTPHMFRHFFAFLLLRKGADIYLISQILGHRSVAVTEDFYADLTADDAAEQADALLAQEETAAQARKRRMGGW